MKNRVQTPDCSRFGTLAKLKRYKTTGVLLTLAGLCSIGSVSHGATLKNYFNFTEIGATNTQSTIADYFGTNATVKTTGTTLNSSGLSIAAGNNAGTTGVLLPPEAFSSLTNDFTVQIWYTTPASIPGNTAVFGGTTTTNQDSNLTGDQAFWAGYNGSVAFIRPIVNNNTQYGMDMANTTARTGTTPSTLYDYVITYSSATHTFNAYMNGIQVGSMVSSLFNGLAALTNGIAIGGVQTPAFGDNATAVTISDFLIFDGALSPVAVVNIHALGAGTSVSSLAAALAPLLSLTWNGGGGDDNWGTGLNWVGGTAPATSGASLTFAGSTRTTPKLDANYRVAGLTFSNNAASFTLGTANGSTLNLMGDVVNNSANAQTLNVPLSLGVAASLNAAAGSLVVNSNISLGPLGLTLAGNNSFTVNSSISGSGDVIKTGTGTLTLAGSILTTGRASFNDGTTVVTGGVSASSTSATYIGYTSGNGVLNLQSGSFSVGGDLRVGGSDVNGTEPNGTGAFTLSSGTAAYLGSLTVARGNNNQNSVAGTVTLNSGTTIISTNDVTLGFAGTGLGKLAINGGTFIMGPAATKWLTVGYWDTTTGELDITSGNLFLENNSSIKMCRGNSTGANVINQSGGSLTFYSDAGVTAGGTGNLDLNYGGGSTSVASYNLNGGTLTVPQITATRTTGTTAFNFNGGTLKPTASTTTFMQRLTAANVLKGGAIIDTAGFDISLVQTLADGGDGGMGGLTKLGAGTLTLAGGYTYTGPTRVQAGTLALDGLMPSAYGDLAVNNAALSVSLNNGNGLIYAGAMTFSGNCMLNLNYGTAMAPAMPAFYANSVSVSGTTIINITGDKLVPGQYPLIFNTYGGSVSAAGFSLGSLPTGMQARLVSTASSLDLLITGSAQNLTWYGADSVGNLLSTWDINTSMNWSSGTAKYLQYSANAYGDNVTFDDTLFSAAAANITLNTTVVPASVSFNNASTPYSITGTGGIGGAASVTISGGSSVFLGTSNSYTRGTFVSAGTLTITNDSALGAKTGTLTLAGGALQLNGVTSARSIALKADTTLGVAAGANSLLSGPITGASTLTKVDTGALTLAGNVSNVAAVVVSAGTLNVTGTVASAATTVGDAAGETVLNISGNLSGRNLFVGNGAGAVAVVRQTGGTLSLDGGTGDVLNVGNASGSYGYYNASGGVLNVNGISIGGESNPSVWPPTGTGDGIMEVNGATINNIGWIVLARGGDAETGVLNMYSGLLTYSGGGIGCNWQLSGSGQTSIINILGGSILSTNQGVNFRSADTGVVNLNGGVLQGTSVTGPGTVNFNGGTLKAAADNTGFLGVNLANVYGGGATIDDGGYAITVAQPLVAPAGYGVSSIPLTTGGSGYIAPPIVIISGGTGSNATAVATVAGGIVTGLRVTSPGTGYTAGDVLTVSFSGGGATVVPPTVGTVTLAANTSGGLTKNGAGTLTLNSTNTYTGATTINAGTLAGMGVIPGALINNATLAPGNGLAGVLTVKGDLTLNSGSTSVFAVNGTTLANTALIAGGKVNYGGVLKIVPSGTVTVGQQFVLFSGAGATSASNFTSIQSTASGVGFSFTNGVLTVVPAAPSTPAKITAAASGNTLSLSWPADHLGWVLQVQTNSLSTGLSTNWVDVAGSGSLTSTNITVGSGIPTGFYRLRQP